MARQSNIEIKESVESLNKLYFKERNHRVRPRIKCLILFKESKLKGQLEIAIHLGVDYATVKRWLKQYKAEGFNMFEEMINTIQEDTVKRLFHVVARKQPIQPRRVTGKMTTNRGESAKQVTIRTGKAPGPNDPRPCGSGKKYKKCCGR